MFARGQQVRDLIDVMRQRTGNDNLMAVWIGWALLPPENHFDEWYDGTESDDIYVTDDDEHPPDEGGAAQ
jgi:hypothetical protein